MAVSKRRCIAYSFYFWASVRRVTGSELDIAPERLTNYSYMVVPLKKQLPTRDGGVLTRRTSRIRMLDSVKGVN